MENLCEKPLRRTLRTSLEDHCGELLWSTSLESHFGEPLWRTFWRTLQPCNLAAWETTARLQDRKTHGSRYENAWKRFRGQRAAKRRAFFYLEDRKTRGGPGKNGRKPLRYHGAARKRASFYLQDRKTHGRRWPFSRPNFLLTLRAAKRVVALFKRQTRCQ